LANNDKPIYYASISEQLPPPFCRINIMRTPGDYCLEDHCHEFYHVNHILEGSLKIISGGHIYKASAGQTFVMPSKTVHKLCSDGGYSQIGMDILETDDERGLFSELAFRTLGRITVTSAHIIAVDAARMTALLDVPICINLMRAVNLAESILIDTMDAIRESDPKSELFVKNFTDMLKDTKPWELSLNDMCNRLGISRAGLERAAKQLLGCGAVEYCARLRFKEICTLLKTTDLTLEAIALQCGFCGAGHLSVFFVKRAGFTPGQYRQSATQYSDLR
jgi:AraC-like DNA-binding protein